MAVGRSLFGLSTCIIPKYNGKLAGGCPMDMSSGYYIVFLVAIVASVAAISQQQLGIAFIAFLVAIAVFWLSKRNRK